MSKYFAIDVGYSDGHYHVSLFDEKGHVERVDVIDQEKAKAAAIDALILGFKMLHDEHGVPRDAFTITQAVKDLTQKLGDMLAVEQLIKYRDEKD